MAFTRSGVRFPSPPLGGRPRSHADMAQAANAGIAQLVEHNLAKVGVASSSLVSRSILMIKTAFRRFFFLYAENSTASRFTRSIHVPRPFGGAKALQIGCPAD